MLKGISEKLLSIKLRVDASILKYSKHSDLVLPKFSGSKKGIKVGQVTEAHHTALMMDNPCSAALKISEVLLLCSVLMQVSSFSEKLEGCL